MTTSPRSTAAAAAAAAPSSSSSALRHRWFVDVSAWTPSEDEFEWVCSTLILDTEVTQVKKYKFEEDRKRALVSLILQRTAGVEYHGWRRRTGGCMTSGASTDAVDVVDVVDAAEVSALDVELGKTKGRKPYIVKREKFEDNFNYNVSHDGRFVVLASELYCVCGCDVSSAGSLMGKVRAPGSGASSLEGLRKTLGAFEKQLTDKEWDRVWDGVGGRDGGGTLDDDSATRNVASAFAKYWSLKESYVKAIGMGLGYDMGRVEFEVLEGGRAEEAGALSVAFVTIDGELSENWCCYLQGLRDDHWVSVARGPVTDVVDALGAFSGGFGVPNMGRDELNTAVFQELEPAFDELTVGDLIKMGYGVDVYERWRGLFSVG